ncbi:MAG: LysR family transcriptional regulator [Pseudomonadota bacterium]
MPDLLDHAAAVALSEECHFGRAARRLGISQPALTARLRRLEAAIGARLFERSRSGVRATAAGIAFVEGARRTLDAAEASIEAARAAQDGFGEMLRIGFTQIAAHQVMAPMLDRFRRASPEARLSLTEGTTASLERDLEQGGVDVAFLHPPLHAAGLSSRDLHEGPIECRFLNPAGESRPPVGVPRHKAPVLVGELDRLLNRLALDSRPFPPVEADTLVGSLVLSAAGYGAAVVVAGFPAFGFVDCSARMETGLTLRTAIAWRRLDRRPIVASLLEACGTLETPHSGRASPAPRSAGAEIRPRPPSVDPDD